jgi:C4-dicarboxylate-specific signal transduction histidine kinase
LSSRIKLLLVEDSPDDSDLLLKHLKRAGLETIHERVETERAMISALESKEWDTVICDYDIPGFGVIPALLLLKEKKPDIPCIVVSGSVGEDRAVETMKSGASDYIMKDNLTRLVPAIQRELKEAQVRRDHRQVEEALKKREEELRQVQKLEAVGQLAGGIAHDFNNILATILIQADILNDALDEALPMEQLVSQMQKGIEQIKKSGIRATNLTRQLLAFSRKQVIQSKVLNLNDIVSDMEKMVIRLIEENIEVKTSLSKGLKNIRVDPGHLEQQLY